MYEPSDKMVRPKIDLSVQIEVYKKYRSKIFQENGKAKPCSDEVYKILVVELDGMTEKSIQTSINRNVKEICVNSSERNDPPDFIDVQHVEDNAEKAVDSGSDEHESNMHYLPSEFVEVSMQFTDKDENDPRCSSPLSNSYDLQDAQFQQREDANRENDQLLALYHKKSVQEEDKEIDHVHESIDKLAKNYRNKIAMLNETHQHICRSFQHNHTTVEEEINRLKRKDEDSVKLAEEAKTKISDMEITFSVERQAFNEEINRLKRKDEDSVKLAEEAKTKISDMEITFSVERQAFNEEINRLKRKDEDSVKLAEEAVNLSEQSRKRLRCGEIVPRETRTRKCNSNK